MSRIRPEYLNIHDVTAAPDLFVHEEPDEEEDDEPEDDENDDQEEHQNSGYSE